MCIRDRYEAGIKNDRCSLIYEGNKENKIAVNTPAGQTSRMDIPEIIMQGSTWGSLLCSIQTDKIGKDALEREEYVYSYKEKVNIPPLAMVDDILAISECGSESVKTNAYINARFEEKRLELNEKKCVKIHATKESNYCPELYAHDETIESVDETKYLGDILKSNGKNKRNVESRFGTGLSVITSTMRILNEVSVGKFYYIIAKIFRESMLINSILLNTFSSDG